MGNLLEKLVYHDSNLLNRIKIRIKKMYISLSIHSNQVFHCFYNFFDCVVHEVLQSLTVLVCFPKYRFFFLKLSARAKLIYTACL